MGILIVIVIVYVVIAVLIYLVTIFIDGRKIGKGEITKEWACKKVEDHALVAIFWPIVAVGFLAVSPFILFHHIGDGVRKLGEYTTTRRNISSGDTNC